MVSPPVRDPVGRVAIVVGAGSELGQSTAAKLAATGFTVVGVDRNEDRLKELPDGIRYEAADATDPVTARTVVDRIAAEFGLPAVLVNVIGTYHLGEALTATPEDLRLMLDVNAGTALWLTQAVTPYMRDRGSGSIVHVAARPGLEPTAGMVTYSVSKAALIHLTRVLDLELRPLGHPGQRRRAATAQHGRDPALPLARGPGARRRAGSDRRHHRLPRRRRGRADQRRDPARLRRLKGPAVSGSTMDRRGAVLAAVPAVASLAGGALAAPAVADTGGDVTGGRVSGVDVRAAL